MTKELEADEFEEFKKKVDAISVIERKLEQINDQVQSLKSSVDSKDIAFKSKEGDRLAIIKLDSENNPVFEFNLIQDIDMKHALKLADWIKSHYFEKPPKYNDWDENRPLIPR